MKKFKKLLPALLVSVLVLSNSISALACTGVYVGNEVSENGSTYMGRSEDIGDLYGKIFSVAPARDIAEGEIYQDTYGFKMDYSKFTYPSRTYSYTYVKDTPLYGETMKDANGNYIGEAYAEAGQNEKGLSMSATVSTSYSKAARTADRLVSTGICEISLTSILLGGAATAREAVELLADIIDEYGAGECNSLMFSDPNETWYFEIVSGHQYAAVKMPADKVSIQPNLMLLGVIDVTDTANVVASENLVSLAEENGFLVTDESGKIDVTKTYLGSHSSNSRYYQGLFYINEEAAKEMGTSIGSGKTYPLYLDPAKKLSTMDVLRLLGYRGEGSEMESASNSIGNNRQSECHIFETRQGMPTELAIIQWQAMADAEFSIYVPYYTALVTETNELYHTTEKPNKNSETNGQINMNFQIINNLCYNNRANCAAAVKAYFEAYQESLIAQQAEVDAVMEKIYLHGLDAAKLAATETGKDLAEQVSAASSAVLAELRAYLAGDKATPFALSEETLSMMPVYRVSEDAMPEHDMEVNFDENNHWDECETCGTVENTAEHTWAVKSDAEKHWQECECGAVKEDAAHTFEEGECTECEAKDPNYVPSTEDGSDTDAGNNKAPQTGDNSPIFMLTVLAFVSAFAFAILLRRKFVK